MLTAGSSFLLLNAVTAVSVAVLVKGLLSTHQKERDLTNSLKKEQSQLVELKNELEQEVLERKQTEEALRESEEKLARSKKMESLGLLAGGVAHDLNNVLSGIVSYPELILLDLPEDSTFRAPIETIKESGLRAAAIVQDLLTVARGVAITRDEILEKGLDTPLDTIRGAGEKILVVDDVETQREISTKMLQTMGYHAESVSSGEAAVDYIKTKQVDLLLLDMIMDPGMNGRKTYERVIEIQPQQKAIIVSGFAETEDVRATQKLGAGQYIKKPITLETLGLAVKDELAKGR